MINFFTCNILYTERVHWPIMFCVPVLKIVKVGFPNILSTVHRVVIQIKIYTENTLNTSVTKKRGIRENKMPSYSLLVVNLCRLEGL